MVYTEKKHVYILVVEELIAFIFKHCSLIIVPTSTFLEQGYLTEPTNLSIDITERFFLFSYSKHYIVIYGTNTSIAILYKHNLSAFYYVGSDS